MPMKVGKTYQLSRYFKTGYNPIQVTGRVARFDPPAEWGERTGAVVEVTARGTTVGVRFTDDARRLPVQLDLPLPYGSVTLELTSGA